MAQRTFLPQLRISATVKILLLFFCGSILIQLTAAKSSIIDDGGVTVPPALPFNTRQVLAIRNRPLALHCPIIISNDVRILDLWWLKDGSKLDLNPQQIQNPTTSDQETQPVPRIWITDDGDLHFEKIIHKIVISRGSLDRHKNYTDEGDYRCVVKSPTGVVQSPVINVAVAALENRDGKEEVKGKVGGIKMLECQIFSTPPLSSTHLQVTWQRGHTNVSRLAQDSNRFSILSSGTLAIANLQPSDSGTYRCFVKHDVLRKERSADIKLVVETTSEVVSSEPPKFLFASDYDSQLTTIILDEEEEHVLDCLASGIPLPSITWVLTYEIVNGSQISPFSKVLSEGKVFHDSIQITPDNSIGGNYTCLSNNGIGNPITKTIQVARLPALIKGPNSYKYPPAKTVRFECRVPPTYTLIWYKDGQLLETGKGRVKARGNEIVISNTIRNDSGFYQCEVVAEDHIYAVGTARLVVENNREAPDAPFDLQCIESFSRALNISWKVASKENVTAFSVHYTPFGGEERQKVTPSKSNNYNYSIESLKPYTNYSIYVRSYSVKSASAQSPQVVCSTLEDVPAKAPKNFVIERYGPPTQVRIRWRPLLDTESRGKVILYKLQWRSIDGEFTKVRYIDGAADEFLITELTPGQPFELRLLPSTSVGWPINKENFPWIHVNSTNNNESNATVHDEEGYKAPTMDLTVLNSTSILVNWSEPPRPKELSVKGYRLTYSTYIERVDDVVFFGPFYIYDYSVRSFLFSDFAASTSYEVQLQTFGDIWESELASKFIGTFSSSNGNLEQTEDFLPVITGLHVQPLSSSEVRLTWELPKPTNSQLNFYYTVKYNEADSNDFHYISSTSEYVEIRELKPYTSYEFVVQLTTADNRGGPFSQKIESRTLPGIPGAPVKLHWRVLNQSLVEVEWQPPPLSNGVIQKYWVQYKHKNESLEDKQPSIIGSINISSPNVSDETWKIKATKNTSLFLENLLQNEEYAVRVIAETRAGVGDPSDLIFVRIFIKKPPTAETSLPKDDPRSEQNQLPNSTTPQYLGIIIGVGMSVLFILVCVSIITFRHRLFPMFTRRPIGVHMNGNGLPPRAKRSLESFNGVEMKVLETLTANDQHLLDTKGGHTHANGVIPCATDPLLMRIVRNPIDNPHLQDDEESVPNCIH